MLILSPTKIFGSILKNRLSRTFIFLVISLNLLVFYTFLLIPLKASGQTIQDSENYCRDLKDLNDPKGERLIYMKLGVPIPGITSTITDEQGRKIAVVKDLPCFIYYFYKYFASVVGILAAVMIMYGGFRYLTSFGNPSRITAAKEQITSAVIGLLLVLGTYIILYTINPTLVRLQMPPIQHIAKIVQGRIWCPEEATFIKDKNGKDIGDLDEDGVKDCGEKGTTAGIDEGGGECTFAGNCGKDKLCGLREGKYAPYECRDMKEVCEKTDPENCKATDEQLVMVGRQDKVCKFNSYYGKCGLRDLNSCWDGWKRVECNIGGGLETPCWYGQENEPKSDCTDDPRVNSTDFICCGYRLKTEIDCRKVSDGCHNDEVKVDCNYWNGLKNTNYDSCYENNACNLGCNGVDKCFCSEVCCMELKLK